MKIFIWTFVIFQALLTVTKGNAMKIKKYQDITPSNRTNFAMVYHHAGRTLTQIETLLKNAYGKPLPTRPQNRLDRIKFKLEQMAARHKQREDELKSAYKTIKSYKSAQDI